MRRPFAELAQTPFEDGTFIDCGWSPLEDAMNHYPFQACPNPAHGKLNVPDAMCRKLNGRIRNRARIWVVQFSSCRGIIRMVASYLVGASGRPLDWHARC